MTPEEIKVLLKESIVGQRGEVRLDCPNCTGGQKETLSINADSGLFSCFRCDIKGNVNHNGKQPLPEYIWSKAQPTFKHPYLEKKQVPSYGLKQDRNGNLVVPLYNHKQIATLHFIEPDGKKNLLSKEKGGFKKGSCFTIPTDNNSAIVYVCEGYATTATVRAITGCTTIMAVDAGNILPVTENIRYKYRDKTFIFCADNDENAKGLIAASKAAALVGGKVTMPDQVGKDFNDIFIEQGREAALEQLGKFVEPVEPILDQEPETENKFAKRFITGADLDAQFIKTLDKGFLIEDVLPENSNLIVLYGSPGTFKSFIALDMGLSVAAGVAWQWKHTKKRSVLYSAAEGQTGVLKRVYAWKKHHDIKTVDNFTLMPLPCLVDNNAELEQFIHAIKIMPEIPSLVILDTLARSMIGDENSTSDMGKVVHAAGRITEETGAQVLIVHHTGKDESRGPRGAIALLGATDTMFRVCKHKEKRQAIMKCERQKDDEPFKDMVFDMELVETGYLNKDQQPVNSLVPVYDPEAVTDVKKAKNSVSGSNLIALRALEQALEKYGVRPSDEIIRDHMGNDPMQMCLPVVHEDDWRRVAYSMGISDGSQDAKQKAFKRARAKLIELEKIKTWDSFYWTL